MLFANLFVDTYLGFSSLMRLFKRYLLVSKSFIDQLMYNRVALKEY